jgi:hypothetical protein
MVRPASFRVIATRVRANVVYRAALAPAASAFAAGRSVAIHLPTPTNELPEASGVEDLEPRNLACLQEVLVVGHKSVRTDRQCLAQKSK